MNKKLQNLKDWKQLLIKIPGVSSVIAFDMQEKRKIYDDQARENNEIREQRRHYIKIEKKYRKQESFNLPWEFGIGSDSFEENIESCRNFNKNYTKIYTYQKGNRK